MASVNKIILVGNLGTDPELRKTKDGTSVCGFSLATSDQWRSKTGEKKEKTEWHKIKVWGAQGESCSTYLKKGRQVYIEGKVEYRKWEDKEHQMKYTTEIKAETVQFLGSKPDVKEVVQDNFNDIPF